MPTEDGLRFVLSRVDGLPDGTEVAVFPDRLELLSAGKWVSFRFVDIAKWPAPAWISRLRYRFGWRPRWLPIADRDWFHPPAERFFSFYSNPPVTIRMPVCDPYERERSTFDRVK